MLFGNVCFVETNNHGVVAVFAGTLFRRIVNTVVSAEEAGSCSNSPLPESPAKCAVSSFLRTFFCMFICCQGKCNQFP